MSEAKDDRVTDGNCAAFRSDEFIDAEIMSELAATTELLERLKREFSTAEKSPRFLVLDHCIQCCNAYLETLINQEHHIQVARSAHRYGETLKSELSGYMAMLQNPSDPGGGGGRRESRSDAGKRTTASPEAARIARIARCEPPGRPRGSAARGDRAPASMTKNARPLLRIYLFGEFRAYLNDEPIECWPKGKSKQLFKYLVACGGMSIPKEKLMELFWPDHNEQSARNNLNVAIYSLRQSLKKQLPGITVVLFRDGCYLINPKIRLWTDAAELESCVREAPKYQGKDETEKRMERLQCAEELYTGLFLAEDAYLDWVVDKQLQYQEMYLTVLEKLDACYRDTGDLDASIAVNKNILAIDNCNEKAHRRLMENYMRMGQRHLAIKQFELCETTLQRELDLAPQQSLVDLFNQIKEIKIA